MTKKAMAMARAAGALVTATKRAMARKRVSNASVEEWIGGRSVY